jgi:hypothetical protein
MSYEELIEKTFGALNGECSAIGMFGLLFVILFVAFGLVFLLYWFLLRP